MRFNGEVTELHLSRTYSASSRAKFWAICLTIFALLIPGFTFLTLRLPVSQPESVGLAFVIGIVAFAFLFYLFQSRFGFEPRVKWLMEYRPWLLGPVHGTFSAAFTTIWHKDVGIQLVSQDLFSHLSFNAYVVRAKGNSYAIVPTACFFESDWHLILDTLELRQPGFLMPIPPMRGANVCILPSRRLSFLEMRLRSYRWSASEGGASWLVAALLTYNLWWVVDDILPIWFMFAMVPALVFAFFLFRVALWTWHTKRQFANETRGYLAVPETEPGRTVSWFNHETIFWCAGRMWIHFPTRYVDRVRVDFSVIEFQARGIEMLFHREGFQSQADWLAACDTSRELMVNDRSEIVT